MSLGAAWIQIGDGTGIGYEPGSCAPPVCNRSDPAALHIYHFRSPSLEDAVKKNMDWQWRGDDAAGDDLMMADDVYDQVRLWSIMQFAERSCH